MKRLGRILRTSIVYSVLIFMTATYPLDMVAHAEAGTDTASDPTTQSQTSNTPVTQDTTEASTPTPSTTSTPPSTLSTDASDSSQASTPVDSGTSTSDPSTPSTTSSATDSTASTATNSVGETATTGDATVTDNTTAGSATSGNASDSATVLNDVNSSVTTSGQPIATFTSNINGDVQGDIILQPMIQQATMPLSSTPSTDTSITVNDSTQLANNITLTATSGNTAVTNNTSAGDATTGSATTMADIVNVVNSMVSSGQSFVGTINIYGTLTGNILISPTFIPQLIAANEASGNSETLDAHDTQAILNNVSLNARSGTASVTNNTTAGSATSGNAQTSLVILNLSGHHVIASDSLLVFVNVLGQWVGLIVDAPAGATAAALGDGVTENALASAGNTSVTTNNDAQIINNVNLTSLSGDATVANNTKAGNATTGNATASANIANLTNDSLGLSGWFGILFINVFGNWFGNFGITPTSNNTSGLSGSQAVQAGGAQVLRFVPHIVATQTIYAATLSSSAGGALSQPESPASDDSTSVLGASTTVPSKHQSAAIQSAPNDTWIIVAAVIILAGMTAAGMIRFKRV